MEIFTASEQSIWEVTARAVRPSMTDDEINAKYTSREWRIITESNREQLPNFVEALKRPGWMELRPFYQRRLRWDEERQSKLIESFIMNIPVPPLFVYESDLAKYEVMDGQQRITALRNFYSNELRLCGLLQWPELNGRTYSKLPSEIKKGIDRRSISYTVLLKESATTTEEESLLRQMVFERLNTGGVRLEQQEIRNCLYHGSFNDILFELAKNPIFRRAWGLPLFGKSELTNPPKELLENSFYATMNDVELILRFFALRHASHYQRGMGGFLDIYMVRARKLPTEELEVLKEIFIATIELAHGIYGEYLFKPWIVREKIWSNRPQVAFYDAIMVGICRNIQLGERLLFRKEEVIDRTKELFELNEDGTFTGRGNSKSDVNERINLLDLMLKSVAGE